MLLRSHDDLLRSVHPRVCGEHLAALLLPVAFRGSSPRVRGTSRDRWERKRYPRFIPACAGNIAKRTRHGPAPWFIPACAGNISSALFSFFSPSVHPRVCGEHIIKSYLYVKRNGSSPRVRGTSRPTASLDHPFRFIPACAGNIRKRPE